MRENRVRALWQAGGAAVNGWLGIPSAFSAEVMAHAGFDSLTVDMQHGLADYHTAVSMLQAIATTSTNVTPLARVPWNEPASIMRMLDAGCYGIICPMINTRAQAEAFVGACRYAPHGYRSFGPTRASIYAGADYFDHANTTVITMAMIETAEAMQNLDAILSVPGLDAIYVGPSDLAISLGYRPRMDPTDAPMTEALDTILAATKRHGIVAGIHCGTPAYARQMIAKGFQFVTLSSDTRMLAAAAGADVGAMRAEAAESRVTY